jgi:hypothetical protein
MMMMVMVVVRVIVLWSREQGKWVMGHRGGGRTHMRHRGVSPGICSAVRCGICCCRCCIVCHFERLVLDLGRGVGGSGLIFLTSMD